MLLCHVIIRYICVFSSGSGTLIHWLLNWLLIFFTFEPSFSAFNCLLLRSYLPPHELTRSRGWRASIFYNTQPTQSKRLASISLYGSLVQQPPPLKCTDSLLSTVPSLQSFDSNMTSTPQSPLISGSTTCKRALWLDVTVVSHWLAAETELPLTLANETIYLFIHLSMLFCT